MAAPQKIKPGIAGILIGILLMIVGIGSCVGGPVAAGIALVNSLSDTPMSERVTVPDTYTFEAEANASGAVVAFGPSGSSPQSVSAVLTDPEGSVVSLDTSAAVNAATGDESFALIGMFSDLSAGTYTVETSGDGRYTVAVVSADFNTTLLLGGIGLGLVLMLIGFILLIVTVVRRSKAKKAARTAQYLPQSGQPFGGPGGGAVPPAPGFGSPQAPPAPPAPGAFTPPPPPAPPADAPTTPYTPPAPQNPAPQNPAPPAWGPGGNDQTPPPPPPWGNS